MINDIDVMTIKEAATAIGIGLATVYRRIENNKIPTVIVGGKKMILKSVVESLRGSNLDTEQILPTDYSNNTNLPNNDNPIDINDININKRGDLNIGLSLIQAQINFLTKKNELEELQGIRLKPAQLKAKEESLNQREKKLIELENSNREYKIELDNMYAKLNIRIKELDDKEEQINNRGLKAQAVEKELKKRIVEFNDKIQKDNSEIKARKEELDIRENSINYNSQILARDIENFNIAVERWRRCRTGKRQ